MHFKHLLLSTLITASFAAAATEIPIEALHASLKKAGFDSMEMPEYKKQIVVAGTVLELTQGLTGSNLVSLGPRNSSVELARASMSAATSPEKLGTLKPGAAFKARCVVNFSMGSQRVALGDCVLQ